jgi:hypothetical protein
MRYPGRAPEGRFIMNDDRTQDDTLVILDRILEEELGQELVKHGL